MKKKLIRTATVSISLDILLKGQLSFLGKSYEVLAVSGQDEHLQNVENREHVRTENVLMKRSISPMQDFISLVKLYKLFKKEKPLIVHSITPKAGLLSMIAAYFAGVPIRIHTFTGLIFPYKTGTLHHLLLFMDKLLCRFATHVFPEGEGVKNDLMKCNVTSKPLKVIANGNVNGIDVNYFSPDSISENKRRELKEELNINDCDTVFVYVGRLVSDKGMNELIDAFSKLSSANKNCKLLLVGPFENELDPLDLTTTKQIETNTNIISVGFQEDIRPYLVISQVFVFPSYREGFPNVVLQAGAMQLPCIVSDISGSNEIIKNNYNGIIVPVKNSEVLLEKMKLFLDDNLLAEKLKRNARQIIVSNYEQQMVWNALLNEYKKIESNV